MEVHRITLYVVDMDFMGAEEVKSVLENTRYPNRCISPDVLDIETRDIGEWDDDHPLNKTATADDYYRKLFEKENNA